MPNAAGVRRMTVDELEASLTIVAGTDAQGVPIRWQAIVAGQNVDALSDDGFGTMLGRPDYVSRTREDTNPNALYAKFVSDAARNVCNQMMAASLHADDDPAREPTLWRDAPIQGASDANISANLRYLGLRFWGVRHTDSDPAMVSLRRVYDAARTAYTPEPLAEQPPSAIGWRAVCVALIEDPAFHLR